MHSVCSQTQSTHSRPRHRALRLALAFASTATLATATATGQTLEFFGEWATPGATELYVSTGGADANPGTLVAPLRSITAAVALVTANGDLGTVPVTINLMTPIPGVFDAASGEGFPITLPAHGITIEAHDIGGGPLPIVDASAAGVRDTFLFDTVGAAALPDSVLRGIDIQNEAFALDSTQVRIDVMLAGLPAPQRVAVEIRECDINGGSNFGVDIVSNPGVILEPVLERNIIRFDAGLESDGLVGVRVTGGTAPCSPVIRSNGIQNYPVNLLLQDGGLTNQPRVQSNFIQVGEVNVRCDDCAPFLIGNTIAFADGAAPIGLDLIGVTTITLANNLLWNPVQPGSAANPPEVVGIGAIVPTPDRVVWFNYDEDDDLLAAAPTGPNFGPANLGPTPAFVGTDVGFGPIPRDLHLTPASILREVGFPAEYTAGASGFPANVFIPGLPAGIVVRRDHAHDVDFDVRISGSFGDIGADEVTALSGPSATSPTRGATLDRRVGSTTMTDIDLMGNLGPNAAGNWETEVEIIGEPGDLALLLSGVGFDDFVTDPAFPGAMIENTALFQNLLADSTVLPGMATLSNLSVGLGAGTVTVAFVPIPPGGVAVVGVNFGALNPLFLEGEAHLQAVVFDPTLTLVQATNRISIDLNE